MIVVVMLLMMELMIVPLKDVGNGNNKRINGIISSTVALTIMIVLEVKNKK